jgi:hypothetical protein
MALVSSRFAERYAELTSRVPTLTERLLDVQRKEVCERREVEAQAQVAFQDVLHIAAIMIADKKARQQGSTALMDAHALTLYNQKTAVWFPAAPPRTVPFRANRPRRAFPHAAFTEMCDEERELRQWLYGVERRLRQHIEEACSRSLFYMGVLEDTVIKEHRGRQHLMKEEDGAFTDVKQRFFRTVPADYFRHIVLARFGSSAPAVLDELQDTSLEAQETRSRAALCDAEVAARKEVFQYLQTAYDVRLFALNHREVIERYELEEAEANELFPLIAGVCRADFGGTFYHVPALALHLSPSCTALRALCFAQLHPRHTTPQPNREAAEEKPPAAVSDKPAILGTEEVEMEEAEEESSTAAAAASCVADATYRSSVDSSGSGVPPAVEVTRIGMPPSFDAMEEVDEVKVPGMRDDRPSAAKPKEKEKEWEVNIDSTPAVRETLYAYEDVQPVLYATDNVDPVLFAVEEKAPKTENVAAVAATPSRNNSELTCSPQLLPKSIFSCEEVFVGDPFAETKSKKTRKSKKHKKSSKWSKRKRSKSTDTEL